MTNPGLIPYKTHREWVQKHLIDGKDLLLFMVRPKTGSRAIGFTQLWIREDTAEIGVIFRESTRHQASSALSTVATLHLAFCHLNLAWLFSYVIPAHKAAISFNRALGAQEVASDKPGMIKLKLSRAECLGNERYARVFARIKDRIEIVRTAERGSAVHDVPL